VSGPRPPDWNRLVANFADDLERPEYRVAAAELAALAQRFAGLGLPLRRDHERTWEHAHVLTGLDRLAEERPGGQPVRRVLDLGGGNSAVAYVLAARGFEVTVVDGDAAVVDCVRHAAATAGLADRLRAELPVQDVPVQEVPVQGERRQGRLPIAAAAIDVVVCISVIEGVLRCDRPRFWAELRRVLRPGGSLLLTFDFGVGARGVGDPPVDRRELETDIVAASGLVLYGALPPPPRFGADGPPVRQHVPTVDGCGRQEIAYTFGALELRRSG
jgi:SAM-dependent methyltransferase